MTDETKLNPELAGVEPEGTETSSFIFGLHAGMGEMSDDFNAEFPDSFWLGEDAVRNTSEGQNIEDTGIEDTTIERQSMIFGLHADLIEWNESFNDELPDSFWLGRRGNTLIRRHDYDSDT